MDSRIGEMEAFVQVVERGSFAAGAKALGLTPSAISRTIARLEARLGVRLLQRTTRSLSLTPEGETYLVRATAVLADIDEIERGLAAETAEPRGRLRVNANVPFGTHCILPVLPVFLARHPKVTVDLSLSDDVIDLLEERADVAIRIGPLRPSSLRARRLGRSGMVVVAAPAYLERHGTPENPVTLDRHNCLNFNFRRATDHWVFRHGGTVRPSAVAGNFLGNSGELVRLAALAGIGIARLARFHVVADIRAGRLLPLLEAFNPGDAEEINALFVGHERLSLRVRAFIDFLVAHASVNL